MVSDRQGNVGKAPQTILISGASSGIGAQLSREFAAKGYHLALCARRTERLETLQAELQQHHPDVQVRIYCLDVTNDQQVFAVFKQVQQEFNQLDKVIVNAGVGKGARVGTGGYQRNKLMAMTNFVGALVQCEAAMEIFRQQQFGHLVTMSSVSSQRGLAGNMSVYAATKAALASLSEGIRADVHGSEIKVTCIHPGYIDTEITDSSKKLAFIVDVEKGCAPIVKAIEKQVDSAFVPWWPWALMRYLLLLLPNSILRRLT